MAPIVGETKRLDLCLFMSGSEQATTNMILSHLRKAWNNQLCLILQSNLLNATFLSNDFSTNTMIFVFMFFGIFKSNLGENDIHVHADYT